MSRARDVKSEYWFVRITYPHDECATKIQIIELFTTRLLCLTHVGEKNERQHIHLAMTLENAKSKQVLDKKLKDIFPVKGADYSSKLWDGNEKALSYMYHDNQHTVLSNKGYTEEDLSRYKQLNADCQAVIEVNKQRAPGRNVDTIFDLFKEDTVIPTKYQIGKEFLKLIKEGTMYEPGDFKLKAMIEEVYMRLHKSDEEFEMYSLTRLQQLYR